MRKVYLFGMLAFFLSMFGTLLTENLILVNSFAAISGLGLAAITTIPYSLMTEYSNRKEVCIIDLFPNFNCSLSKTLKYYQTPAYLLKKYIFYFNYSHFLPLSAWFPRSPG